MEPRIVRASFLLVTLNLDSRLSHSHRKMTISRSTYRKKPSQCEMAYHLLINMNGRLFLSRFADDQCLLAAG